MCRHVDTDTITNLACALQYPTVVNQNIICISGKDGKSTCNVILPAMLVRLHCKSTCNVSPPAM